MARPNHEQLHQTLVDKLADRLSRKGTYSHIEKNFEYNWNGHCGELDVWASRNIDGVQWNHYYEVKCHRTQKSIETAIKQFERLAHAKPHGHWKFIYYTQEGVKIYKPKSTIYK